FAGAWLEQTLGWKPIVAPRRLAMFFGLSLAVCLLNPYHVHAFTLPSELAFILVSVLKLGTALPDSLIAGGKTLADIKDFDPTFYPLNTSFERAVWWQDGPVFATLAFFPLALIGILSFLLVVPISRKDNGPGLRLGRLLLWLLFGIMGIQVRLLPFFALVSGALTVLNFQDYWAWRKKTASPEQVPGLAAVIASRLGIAVAFGLLMFLAWPGWLHGSINKNDSLRRVSWSVYIDPSWHKAAETLKKLHEEKHLHRSVNFNLDLGHYCAWHCPEVKSFIDFRFPLFRRVAKDYGKIRALVQIEAVQYFRVLPAFREDTSEWQRILKRHDVDYLIL